MSEHSSAATVLPDRAWAQVVAASMGLSKEADVVRVQQVLTDSGVTGGRPPSNQHRARIEGVYFAGIKVIREDAVDATDVVRNWLQDSRADETAEPPSDDAAAAHGTTKAPFSFVHTFDTSFTAFATDGVNLAGKSAILGVILWGLRGTAPTPTLQADIRENWLREAVLVVKIDSARVVIAWRVDNGRPAGALYMVLGDNPIDLEPLRAAGLQRANATWAVTRAEIYLPQDGRPEHADPSNADIDGEAGQRDNGQREEQPNRWPGEQLCHDLRDAGQLSELAAFNNEDEFEEAVAATLMQRLELQSLPVWQRRPGSIDEHDAGIAQHGWKTVAQAMAILDPTSRSVLGEHTLVTNLLLSLFLGSRWAVPTMLARTQKARADQAVAARRRRAQTDAAAREQGIARLQSELDTAKAESATLGDVPAYLDVLAATETAKADSVAEARAHTAWLMAAMNYGIAARALETAEHDLHALTEAAATRRFWHSLRPSCCPRCDTTINESMWARERGGQCSLCASEFIEAPVSAAVDDEVVNGQPDGDNEDNEDEIVGLRIQVEEQKLITENASAIEDSARLEYRARRAAAAQSAAALGELDRAASAERYQLELRIARLEARIEERGSVDTEAPAEEYDEKFAAEVLKAALTYAKDRRDNDQKQALTQVSDIITELGIEFGIRNLIKARLGGNGHLPVLKGETKENFGDLAPGERLRLRIALVIALLRAGRASGTSRHPGLLIIDDLTTHEMNHEHAASMAKRLADVPGLQVITASTYAATLRSAVGDHATIVGPPDGSEVMF